MLASPAAMPEPPSQAPVTAPKPARSAAQTALQEIEFTPPPSKKGGGKIEIHAAPARARSGPRKIPPVTRGTFRPRAFQEWLEALSIPRRVLNGLWGTLGVLGVLVLIGQAVASHGKPKSPLPGQVAYQNVSLRISGQACLQDTSSLTGVKVTLHLPEIPLDLQEEIGKLKDTGERGDFVYETNFSSQKVPTYCIISASCKGYDTKDTKELPLSGQPLTATGPALVLTPTRTRRY